MPKQALMIVGITYALILLWCLWTSDTQKSSRMWKKSGGIIDSHVHIWGDGNGEYPFASSAPLPPSGMTTTSNVDALLSQMEHTGVRGALVIQPIHYIYDHSYVLQAISRHPKKLKAMCLLDPLAGQDYLPSLKAKGFVGVRFNPALWLKADTAYSLLAAEDDGLERMSDERGSRLFEQCGNLDLPVGFLFMKGLNKHHSDVVNLLQRFPKTKVIIDHFGFLVQDGIFNEESWSQLLALSSFPQVYIKVSAAFRNVPAGSDEFSSLKTRFLEIVTRFTVKRMLWGSDWPFVSASSSATTYDEASELVLKWGKGTLLLEDVTQIMSGTSEALFGAWD